MKSEPQHINGLVARAVELHKQGLLADAKALYQILVERYPERVEGWFGLGSVEAQLGDAHGAILRLEHAMAITGPRAEQHHNMAGAKASLGRFEEAHAHFREAIRLKPDYAEAYYNYSGAKKFSRSDELHTRIEALLAKGGWSDADRCFLHFAAGKVYDDIGEYDDAFRHYRSGNQARNASFDFDAYDRLIDETMHSFDPELIASTANAGHEDERCVFIVGMPRSGTTLVEQILSSHSQIHGGGELPDIHAIAGELPKHATDGGIYPDCVAQLPYAAWSGFGKAYMERVSADAPGMQRYIDKNPNNFRYLGLIRVLLPKARIIHCRRDPLDTCLSCYFQNFRNGQDYSFELSDLARYYQGYVRLMDHWSSLDELSIYDLHYEELTAEPGAVSRALISYLGLAWEDNCEQHEKARRPVKTASKWQVRQPVSRASVGRWRRYEAYLGPLVEVLSEPAYHPHPDYRGGAATHPRQSA